MLPKPFSWDRRAAREGCFDGKFIVGVLTTGIYCLPSCSARQPKPENVRVLETEAEARTAGLRPCKRCRPDLFYRGEDIEIELFEALAGQVRAKPAAITDTKALARKCGVSQTKLGTLIRNHAHVTPAVWLKRERVRAACRLLLETDGRVVDVGHAAGFESGSTFHHQFLGVTRMTPGAYRGLNGASVFLLRLPAGYRDREILAYHARDAASPAERVDGRRIFKALTVAGRPAVLELSLEPQLARCRLHSAAKLAPHDIADVHCAALRMLGLDIDIAPFENRASRDRSIAALLGRRRGLRLPLTPTVFEALCWAVIGQQINLAFASALRREILNLAGAEIREMRAHPTPERLAEVASRTLARRRFSRSKTDYLLGAARAVTDGRLPIEALRHGSAVTAERALVRLRGIGPWTARYTLMRGAGFADCAPVGDVALAAALQKLTGAKSRPRDREVDALMAAFAPHRSIATFHLWTSLRDTA